MIDQANKRITSVEHHRKGQRAEICVSFDIYIHIAYWITQASLKC